MSKSIHQQITDTIGSITLDGQEIDFTLPDIMTGCKDILQDEDAIVEFYKNYKTDKYPNGILLNMFHQCWGQSRVNWSADVKRQAIKVTKDDAGKVIKKENIFSELDKDCSKNWIPPVQGLPKDKKNDLMAIVIKLVGLGYDANVLLTDPNKLGQACDKEGIKLT